MKASTGNTKQSIDVITIAVIMINMSFKSQMKWKNLYSILACQYSFYNEKYPLWNEKALEVNFTGNGISLNNSTEQDLSKIIIASIKQLVELLVKQWKYHFLTGVACHFMVIACDVQIEICRQQAFLLKQKGLTSKRIVKPKLLRFCHHLVITLQKFKLLWEWKLHT